MSDNDEVQYLERKLVIVRRLAEAIAVSASPPSVIAAAEAILQLVVPPVNTTMPKLPGTNPSSEPPPPLVSPKQPTLEERAAVEALWNTQRPLNLTEVMTIINAHPEIITIWAAHARFVPVP